MSHGKNLTSALEQGALDESNLTMNCPVPHCDEEAPIKDWRDNGRTITVKCPQHGWRDSLLD